MERKILKLIKIAFLTTNLAVYRSLIDLLECDFVPSLIQLCFCHVPSCIPANQMDPLKQFKSRNSCTRFF